ncbi:MAG: hypothetical protein OXT67_06850, partial [Zetaproteobacteria bacterium]|nr:hypothetical protein [Zetaproteobacteria bacterium]
MKNSLFHRIIMSILCFKFLCITYFLLNSSGFFFFQEKVSIAQGGSQGDIPPKKIKLGGFEPPELDPVIKKRFEQLLNLQKLSPEKLNREEIGKYLNLITKAKRDVEDSLQNLNQRRQTLKE